MNQTLTIERESATATRPATVALAGNPNCGKSTIFNALTGARQHVGNWPGKTVEKKEGLLQLNGQALTLIDLPGTYSLNAFSAEEIVTRDFIIEEDPAAVIAVVDAANLERNLYLVTQLLEMHVPLILALNMCDVAETRHIRIDRDKLKRRLGGIPVISLVGHRAVGLDALKVALHEVTSQPHPTSIEVRLAPELEREIQALLPLITADPALNERYPARWLAIKLLEADEPLLHQVADNPQLVAAIQAASARILQETEEDAEALIADSRYSFISALLKGAISRPQADTATTSDRIDRILTHHVWGVPIFLGIMWIVFQITANVSTPYLDWVDGVISGPVTRWALAGLGAAGLSETWIEALLVDGIITGVGGVLVFIPVLAFLYLAIAVLEDSGYMSRAAFVMDRFMQKLGLHGKSFLPMLVGFGCNVPAIYATRTLENEIDRKITGFLTTFMSCGARLPIYVIFGTAFFGSASGTLVFAMYALGIVIAVITSLVFTRIVFRNKPLPLFVMELPPYRIPNLKNVVLPMWHRIKSFLKNAGTVILAASMFIWLLLAVPAPGQPGTFNAVEMESSLFGALSKLVAPVFAPAGFDNWGASGALVTGFVAKEAVISTMNQLYLNDLPPADEAVPSPGFIEDLGHIVASFGEATILTAQEFVNIIPRTLNLLPGLNIPHAHFLPGEEELVDNSALEGALRNAFTPLAAVAFNVFVLLYVPCMATTAAMRQEFGTRWMLYQIGYTLAVAWLAATLVYQGGLLLGFT
ncbi:MAG: ferrous iron transport protein B [Anaerolineae bacterium]|nr:ferrous iron transport protein B [Anaerolineae bacterium]